MSGYTDSCLSRVSRPAFWSFLFISLVFFDVLGNITTLRGNQVVLGGNPRPSAGWWRGNQHKLIWNTACGGKFWKAIGFKKKIKNGIGEIIV